MLDRKYRPLEAERRWQEHWENEGVFRFDPEAPGPIFSIDTPPPTVSGSLHIGHVFSYTQAEIVARHRRMQGMNVFYPFGFDDNGLPTERLVERQHGVRGADMSREEFGHLCRKTVAHYHKEFQDLWRSLGFSVDWDLCYSTGSSRVQRMSQASFLDLYRKGLVYRDRSPTLWCPECRTSLAQADLEGREEQTAYHRVRFTIDGQPLVVATTRPELLGACVAVAVHPEDLRFNGLKGKQALVPLYGYEVPVIVDEAVDPGQGTGAVMVCTFGDARDVDWWARHQLPLREVIGTDGRILEGVRHVGGLTARDARTQIVSLLSDSGLTDGPQPLEHRISVHERCGRPVEFVTSSQWFVRILEYRQALLDAGDRINWHPPHMKARYRDWVRNLSWDWCISRQRFFGVPFPLWYCRHCGQEVLAHEEALPVNPLSDPAPGPCGCGSRDLEPEPDVMDTWATSSLTPLINARWGEYGDMTGRLLPMSMRTQAHEIIRTWAFYTIAKTLFHRGDLPWRDIMISGFVTAGRGEKISKSKGNAPEGPAGLIAVHGADAVRYWTASARLGSDVSFSERELAAGKRLTVKLWNACRFALSHLVEHSHRTGLVTWALDRWMLDRLAAVQERVSSHLDAYEVGLARQELEAFFWHDVCDNYLEVIKDRLYEPGRRGQAATDSARSTLSQLMLEILKMFAPFVPHVTEEIFMGGFNQGGTRSIHVLTWGGFETPGAHGFPGQEMFEILSLIRKSKSTRGLALVTPIDDLVISAPARAVSGLSEAEDDIRAAARARKVRFEPGESIAVEVVLPEVDAGGVVGDSSQR